jgi:hypothetical protein
MKNVIKSQLYQLRKDKLVYIIFFVVLIMQFTMAFGEADFGVGQDFTGGKFVAEVGKDIVAAALIFIIAVVGEICGADFLDKTSNYEVMSGHRRHEVYMSRAILSLLYGTVGGIIIITAPVVWISVMGGWGNEISVSGYVLRTVLLVFPIMRIICEFVFFTYLIKNPYITMVVGLCTSFAGSLLMELPQGTSVVLGITNMNLLYDFPAWSTYSVVHPETIYTIYDAAVATSDMVATIVVSVVVGTVFLILGYVYYEKDDLN